MHAIERRMPSPSEQPNVRERLDWIIVLVMLAAFGSCGLVALPIGVYAFRRHVTRTKAAEKAAETREIMRTLAAGIAQCTSRSPVDRAPTLPPTSLPVPLALASVSGRQYRSAEADWQDEAYRCARFTLGSAQSAQLQWIRSSNTEGYVRGTVDVNGDMTPDLILEQTVRCGPDGQCRIAEPVFRGES
jgi:hypothetical protein